VIGADEEGPEPERLEIHPVPTDQLTPAQALERRLRGGPRRLRRREVARDAGVSLLSARKLWRALGLANVSDEDVAFSDGDVAALGRVAALVRDQVIDEETAIALARSIGQTTDRLVSWQTETLIEHLVDEAHPAGSDGPGSVQRLAELADDLEALLVYSWRRQLGAAVRRLAGDDPPGDLVTAQATVGFADLVSYTRLTARLEQRELGVLVQRFEALAADVIAAGGGRLVKTVGDEVLFIAGTPLQGAMIALTLSEQMAVDEVVPDVRVGIAHGPVLRSLGDVFGTTVNLASRLTTLAQPGTVVTNPETAGGLKSDDLVLVSQRSRTVRGFGLLQPLLIARAGPGSKLINLD
jgi:adenylate cyclase